MNGNKKSHSKVKLAADQYAGLVQLISSISSTVQSLYYGKDQRIDPLQALPCYVISCYISRIVLFNIFSSEMFG